MNDYAEAYDLTALADLRYAHTRFMRNLCASAMIIFSILLVTIFLADVLHGRVYEDLRPVYGSDYIGLGAGFLIGMWGFRVLRRPAYNVSVSREGIRFDYSWRRPDLLLWGDPRFRLDLWDWSESAARLPPTHLYEAVLFYRPRTLLTRVAYEQILEGARLAGLSNSTRVARASIYGTRGRVLRLRGPSPHYDTLERS